MNTQLLTTLLRWFEDHGVVWDQEHQSIRHAIGTTGPALGVFAKTDIPMGHRLCFIPKTAVLSARNVAIADALEQAQLGGGLALNVAVMHELAHGPASPWCAEVDSIFIHTVSYTHYEHIQARVPAVAAPPGASTRLLERPAAAAPRGLCASS